VSALLGLPHCINRESFLATSAFSRTNPIEDRLHQLNRVNERIGLLVIVEERKDSDIGTRAQL
jgi:hypothetical protein